MRMIRRGPTAGVAALAAVAIAASTVTAAPTIVARWKMDDAKNQAVVADSVGSHPGTAGNTNETLIRHREARVTGSASGTYSTYFKGWRENWTSTANCPTLTAGGALVTVNDVGPDTDNGGGGLFDPKMRPFEFTVNLRGDGNAKPAIGGNPENTLNICGSSAGGISLNVFQQGLFKNAGGQYKLQIDGNGLPDCIFSDDAVMSGGTVNSLTVTPNPAVAADITYNPTLGGSVYRSATWFQVTCRLVRPTPTTARAEMDITNKSSNVTTTIVGPTSTFAGIDPCATASQTTCGSRLKAIYFGKKPGSTDPRDAFSGWLDNITFRYLD